MFSYENHINAQIIDHIYRVSVDFHHQVQKEREKEWHDRHIKKKKVSTGGLSITMQSLFYESSRKYSNALVCTICD